MHSQHAFIRKKVKRDGGHPISYAFTTLPLGCSPS